MKVMQTESKFSEDRKLFKLFTKVLLNTVWVLICSLNEKNRRLDKKSE